MFKIYAFILLILIAVTCLLTSFPNTNNLPEFSTEG
jgi:hypothetical protein